MRIVLARSASRFTIAMTRALEKCCYATDEENTDANAGARTKYQCEKEGRRNHAKNEYREQPVRESLADNIGNDRDSPSHEFLRDRRDFLGGKLQVGRLLCCSSCRRVQTEGDPNSLHEPSPLSAVLKDLRRFERYEAAFHHVVEHRQEFVYLFFAVDDLNDYWQILRYRE